MYGRPYRKSGQGPRIAGARFWNKKDLAGEY